MGQKATEAEKNIRDKVIYQMLLDEKSRGEIVRFAREKWRISERTTDWYINRAKDNISKMAKDCQGDSLARHYALRSELISQCFEQNKPNMVLRIAKDQAKLLGLYRPQRIRQMKADFKGLTSEQCERLLNDESVIVSVNLDKNTGELVFRK